MTHRLLAATAIFAAVVAAPVAAKDAGDPTILQPSSAWNMEYADDSCRLARLFGEGDDTIAFYIERYEPGDEFFMLAAGAPLKKGWFKKTFFTFGPNGYEREINGADGVFGQYEPAFFTNSMYLLPTEEAVEKRPSKEFKDGSAWATDSDIFGQSLLPVAEERIQWLDIKRSNKNSVRLLLGSMKGPMAAMRQCTDQLLTLWGIDLEKHRTMTRPVTPQTSPAKWISSTDYPKDLIRKGAQGLVQFKLTVGADGRASDCTIQRSTRPEGFDKAVCRAFMRNARFDPALDAKGAPMVSYWRNSVRFDMPR